MKKSLLGSLLVSTLLAPPLAMAQDMTGAGATFPAPIYSKWADAYNKTTGARLNYQSVGSGAGIQQIRAKTVDFGASDMPLSDDELAKDGLIQFPTVIGGVVPVVNIKGIAPARSSSPARCSATSISARSRSGTTRRWRHSIPACRCPTRRSPSVRRADGSGTSFIFTNYLSKVNPDWKAKVGEGTAVNWPTGAGGKGNEGVAAFVQRLPNSIGYVEYAYAKQNKMTYTLLKNKDGNFVAPDADNFKAAAAGADWSKSFFQVLTDQAGKDAWPISGATFILMYKTQDKPANAANSLKFFDWAYGNGDKMADDLDYVPLPAPVKEMVRKSWSANIKDASGQADRLEVSSACDRLARPSRLLS